MNKRKVPLFVFITIVVFIVVCAVSKVGYERYQQHQYNERVHQLLNQTDGMYEEITEVLSSKSPSTWVYDRDENLVMTLRVSDKLQSVNALPKRFQEGILQKLNAQVEGIVVSEWMNENSLVSTPELNDAFLLRIKEFSSEDLLKYLAITSTYGADFKGIVNATNGYFGTDIDKLTDEQIDFLIYTFRNESVDLEQYFADTNTNEQRLGLILYSAERSALRNYIIEELNSIDGIDISKENYLVKLTISTQQSSILQSIVDNSMRQLIDLNSDGSYAYDCSVAVVDKATGYIRAFIPGRTSSKKSNKVFSMNTLNFLPNFSALIGELSKDSTFGFSLKEITTPKGDKEIKSLKELYEQGLLSSGTNYGLYDSIALMKLLYGEMQGSCNLSMVHQVTTMEGKSLYISDTDSPLECNNYRICQFFSDEENTETNFGETYYLDTGYVSFYSTADYTVLVLAGCGALGGSVGDTSRQVLESTVMEILAATSKFYPTPIVKLWSMDSLTEEIAECYLTNESYVRNLFEEKFTILSSIEINSYINRTKFEDLYEELSKFLDYYQTFVSAECSTELLQTLQSLRVERMEALVHYST